MNWLILPIIFGFILLVGVTILFIVLPIRLDNRYPFTKTNSWLTAVMCGIFSILYVFAALGSYSNRRPESFLGSLLFLLVLFLVATVAVFLGCTLRDYYAKAAASWSESLQKSANKE